MEKTREHRILIQSGPSYTCVALVRLKRSPWLHYFAVQWTDFLPTAQQPTQQVAFTAYADDDRDYIAGQKVRFDGVRTNIGGHFDNSTTFTCPVDGLYYFSFHVMSDYYDSGYPDSKVSLMVGGTGVVSAWAHYYVDGDEFAQASNSALVQCSAGQDAYLETYEQCHVYSSLYDFSTFSGFLVSEN